MPSSLGASAVRNSWMACLHGIQDRRFVAVKADAALGAAQHPAVLIDEPQLDRRAADVNAQIGFTHSAPAYLWLLMAAV